MPKLFGELFTALIERVNAITPISGIGINVTYSVKGGRVISIKTAGDGSGVSGEVVRFPFSVTVRQDPDSDPATFQRIVSVHSRLLIEIAPITTVIIEGLAELDEPEDEDPEWKPFIPNDVIWLEVGFDDGEPDTYKIKSLGAGDEWEDFDFGKSLIEFSGDGSAGNPFVQTIARAVIARGPSNNEDPEQPIFVQVAYTDFLMVDYDANGKIMKMLIPISGAKV